MVSTRTVDGGRGYEVVKSGSWGDQRLVPAIVRDRLSESYFVIRQIGLYVHRR